MDLRIFTEPQQGASYDALLRLARLSEDAGFDGFFRSDHFLVMGDVEGLPGPTDSWVTLAGLARETSSIRLGTLVTSATFRYPGVLAIQVAQVDQMSGGRIELGIGTGWYAEEHAAYGIPFPSKRFGPFEEQLEIISGLWATPAGETYDFSGKHYAIERSPALPKPVQQPAPPLIIGGGGPRRTPALAAKYAAEFNIPAGDLDSCRAKFGRVHETCRSAGRDPETLRLSAWLTTVCGCDGGEVRRRADAINRDEAELRANQLAGSPAELVERIGQYAELGADRLYLQVLDLDDLDHVELIAAQVLPQVRGL